MGIIHKRPVLLRPRQDQEEMECPPHAKRHVRRISTPVSSPFTDARLVSRTYCAFKPS